MKVNFIPCIHSHGWDFSRVHLTYLPMSLAVTPVANVGHGLRAALEHTESVPHAVDHFSFIRAAIWPCVHAMIHGDVLHKVPLRRNGHEDERGRQWRDSHPRAVRECPDHTDTAPGFSVEVGDVPIMSSPCVSHPLTSCSSTAWESMQNETLGKFHFHQVPRSKQVTW